jgi:phosphate transport system permease protein
MTVSVHTSQKAQKRLRTRYRKEALFKAIGVTALCLSGLFLVVFLQNIIRQAIPAFTQHSVTLTVPLTDLSIGEARDPQTLRSIDYGALVSKALTDQFPDVTAVREKRDLRRLLSNGAGVQLQRMVLKNPALIGTTVTMPFLLDDEVDLHLKKMSGETVSLPVYGTLGVSLNNKQAEIFASANDFVSLQAFIKEAAQEKLRNVQEREKLRQAALQKSDAALRTSLETDLAQLKIERLELEAVLASVDDRATLTESMPSFWVKIHGGVIRLNTITSTSAMGTVLQPLTTDTPSKEWQLLRVSPDEGSRKIRDQEAIWIAALQNKGLVTQHFAWTLLLNGASRDAETAGVLAAVVGSLYTLLLAFAIAFPIGITAAIYLEEFAPKNHLTDWIEININNLAAVPSLIYGLLGLAVFCGLFGMPRSIPIVGGLVLALMTTPILIIAARAALRSVPPSIKQGALAVGASPTQAVFHHVLPPAMPGIMTGTILGMAHALGETAPLIMIGMVAFSVDIPHGFFDPATVLPVQIYMWADFAEAAFQYRTAAAILLLLGFLVIMNAFAVWLRKRFERRW